MALGGQSNSLEQWMRDWKMEYVGDARHKTLFVVYRSSYLHNENL